MRLMGKYPTLDGRKCKVYMSKAFLPEAQVLTALHVAVTYGFPQRCTNRVVISPESERQTKIGVEQLRGNGSRLIEALHRESARESLLFPMRIRTQPSLRAYDE